MGQKEVKVFKLLVETAAEELAKATHMCGSIVDEASWKAFDRACSRADSFLYEALHYVPDDLPLEDEDKLFANLREIASLRIEGWINWQMMWREQQAIQNPTGRYGLMRARRLKLEAQLSPKP